jgi:hypothetical protein
MKDENGAAGVIALLIAAIPIAIVAIDVALHAESVPWADDWSCSLDVAVRSAEGNLRFGDLTAQYNDSRPFFTNLLTAANARLTGWNLRAEMGFSLLLTVGSLALCTSMYRRVNPGATFFVVVPFSVVLFSLTQRFRYMLAIDSAYAFLTFFLFTALWAVTRFPPGWAPLTVAALACGGATFSYANGFLAWLVLAPLLWTVGYRKTHYLFAWAAAAALVLGLFFWDYRFRGSMGGWMLDAWFSTRFVLIFLGSPLTTRGGSRWDEAVGFLGLVGLTLNAIDLERRRRPRRETVAWLSLAAFVVLSAVAISVLRGARFGLGGADEDRYSTLASLFWVAYAALALSAGRLAWRRHAAGRGRLASALVNPVAAVALTGSLLIGEVQHAQRPPPTSSAHRECMLAVPSTGDVECLRTLFPGMTSSSWSKMRPRVAASVRRLAELELSVFANP